MAVFVFSLIFLLSMACHSYAAQYCMCKDGVSEALLQKNIDYACGAGADCTAILQNGACYNPNTVKDHCNWAVNSYFQKKGQASGSCDFAGTAVMSPTPPTTTASGCAYPSSASSGSPSTTNPSGGGTTTTIPGSSGGSPFGLAPIGGVGFTNTDTNSGVKTMMPLHQASNYISLAATLVFMGLIYYIID